MTYVSGATSPRANSSQKNPLQATLAQAESPRKIMVLVCIKQGFTRDQQFYIGNKFDDCMDESEDDKWVDTGGSIIVATKEADSLETAIAEVARLYGCSTEILEGYQIVSTQ